MSSSGPVVAMATTQRTAATRRRLQCPVCGAPRRDGDCPKTSGCHGMVARSGKGHNQNPAASAAPQLPANPVSAANHRVLNAALNALSQLHIGLLLCAESGEILGLNSVAESVLATGDALTRNEKGYLCATQEAGRLLLEMEPQPGGRTRSRTRGSGSVVAVSRGLDQRPLTVFIHTCSADFPSTSAQSACLVMILDSTLPLGSIEAQLWQLYRLTPTEARLASHLMEGSALADCCHALGFSRPTGCTHLRRIFKKTGVHRQTELVALLLKSVAWPFWVALALRRNRTCARALQATAWLKILALVSLG